MTSQDAPNPAPLPLDALLAEIDDDIQTELKSNPEVVDADLSVFDAYQLEKTSRREWHRLEDVVVVVADLTASTQLGVGRHAASTAAIYEASTDNVVRVLHEMGANFVQIQGDGAFGVFWGRRSVERALCAGITIKTFSSRYLTPTIESRWPEHEVEHGFKVGIASERVLVKVMGTPRDEDEQEPVWAGKPVNYAAKAAQVAVIDQLIVTGPVWDAIEDNDFATLSCDCKPPAEIWKDVTIEKIPEDDTDREGRVLEVGWCREHGEEFCNAILRGETVRDEAEPIREQMKRNVRRSTLEAVKSRRKRNAARWRRVAS